MRGSAENAVQDCDFFSFEGLEIAGSEENLVERNRFESSAFAISLEDAV